MVPKVLPEQSEGRRPMTRGPRFRNFRVHDRLTLGDNPLRRTDERGLSIEHTILPSANVVYLCLHAKGQGAIVHREDSSDGVWPPILWEGSLPVAPLLLDRLLDILRRNGVETMEHQYPEEMMDGECFHLLARLERGGSLFHVYLDSPSERANPSASRIFRSLEPLAWYTEEEFIRRCAEPPGWKERLRRWFMR